MNERLKHGYMNIIVGITGASGVILGLHLLKALSECPSCRTHLVITENAAKTLSCETSYKIEDLISIADFYYDINDIAASISSGSFKTDGIIVVPCSMKTLAAVVTGYTDNLLLRAVDVCLKERRKVILVPRETPLNSIHLKNMYEASRNGCIILPPMLTFYNNPDSIQDMVNHITGKIMALFGLDFKNFIPWSGK